VTILGTKILKAVKSRGMGGLLDSGIWKLLSLLRRSLYFLKGPSYGLSEAVFWPKNIDYWLRNSWTLDYLLRNSQGSECLVLDIGSGEGGLSEFVQYAEKPQPLRLILSDFDKEKVFLNKGKGFLLGKVVANAAHLPLKSRSLDFVVAVDLIEHLSPNIRHDFFKEALRVAKRGILIHSPLDSKNGEFRARAYDLLFQENHVQRFHRKEPYTEEHLRSDYPVYEDLIERFPQLVVEGDQNADIWLKYMMMYRRPLIGYFCGLFYLLKWKSKNRKGPYYSGMIYNKSDFQKE
jgi:ubiquinone/menaquinone biosynthesis C-methylase UbiE